MEQQQQPYPQQQQAYPQQQQPYPQHQQPNPQQQQPYPQQQQSYPQQQQAYPQQQQSYPQQQQPNPQQQHQQPMTQPQFIQQPAATTVIQNPQPSDDKLQPIALSQVKGLSITQLVMGVLCMIFGIILVAIEGSDREIYDSDALGHVGYGIWIGVYFILLGGIGLATVKFNTSRWISSAMYLNLISSCSFWLILLSLSSAAINVAKEVEVKCIYLYYSTICYTRQTDTLLALNSLMLIMAVIELVISIWTAFLCYGAVGRCCKGPQGQVVSNNNGQVQTQQPVMVTSGVPAANPNSVTATNAQPGGQTQFAAQPMVMQQQPIGYVQPQEPPSYYTACQSSTAENASCDQPPPTAYPTKS